MKKSDAQAFLDKVGDDEPIFIIRAQDRSATYTVAAWICANVNTAPTKKLHEALDTALAMRDFPDQKDAD